MTDTGRVKPAYQAGHVSIDTNDWVALQGELTAARERAEAAQKRAAAWGKAARAYRTRWLELVDQKIRVPWFQYQEGQGSEMVVEHPVFMLVAEFMRESFKACEGVNYVEWAMQAVKDPGEKYTLTMQRCGGKSPHELRADAERERDIARGEADRCREVCDATSIAAQATESERDAALAEAAALREGLEWALREGGWRLWYYASDPPPAVAKGCGAGADAMIAIDAGAATLAELRRLREVERTFTDCQLGCPA
jgi:hypothetical protein